MTVIVDDASLRRAWKRIDGDFLWEFVSASAGVDLSAVGEAVEAANASTPEGTGAWGTVPLVTERGTTVSELYADPDWEEDRRWFEVLAASLADRGLVGRIAAAREARLPKWIEGPGTSFLTAMIGLPVDPAVLSGASQGRGQLGVQEALTRWVGRTLAVWYSSQSSRSFLLRQVYLSQVAPADAMERVLRAASSEGAAAAVWMQPNDQEFRSLRLAQQGTATAQLGTVEPRWGHELRTLESLVRHMGSVADVVWCRRAPRLADWGFTGSEMVAQFRQFPQLRARFVPDAHGIFVLTPEHLAKARDLSDWRLEDLGNDRTLVMHSDLEAWFAQKEPDPAVVAKARADLGPMILTKEDVRGHRISLGLPV